MVLRVAIGVAIGIVILLVGMRMLRSMASGEGPRALRDAGPEDVEALEVFFVCGECGTEFRVTRLGEMQVPRHCGEKMSVVRRPTRP